MRPAPDLHRSVKHNIQRARVSVPLYAMGTNLILERNSWFELEGRLRETATSAKLCIPDRPDTNWKVFNEDVREG